MIRNDRWIREQAALGMIAPFEPQQVRELQGHRCLSYGTSSYGYDIRLSPAQFLIPSWVDNLVDPKSSDTFKTQQVALTTTDYGQGFVIPGGTFGLGVSVEHFKMPPDTIAVALGKSTLARYGLVVNITPLEPSWEGFLTIEISNTGPNDVLVYANEGIAQLLFFSGEPCDTTYGDRAGKYQGQDQRVVLGSV